MTVNYDTFVENKKLIDCNHSPFRCTVYYITKMPLMASGWFYKAAHVNNPQCAFSAPATD